MVKKLIASIRRKPQSVRDSVALWIAMSFTGVVVAIWAYHLPSKFEGVALELPKDDMAAVGSSFQEMQDNISSAREEAFGQNEQPVDSLIESYREQAELRAATSASSSVSSEVKQESYVPLQKPESIRIITTSEATSSSSLEPE